RQHSYVYDFRPGISAYQLNDEMENRLRRAGYLIVYRCQGSECGEIDGWRVFMGKYVSGIECSQYYVLARRVRSDAAQQLIQIYANDIGRSPRLIAHTYEAEVLVDVSGRELGKGNVEIPFGIDSAELTLGGREALRRFVAQLVKSGIVGVESIEVAGYTDAQGTAARNEQLSSQRAEAIAQWLRGEEMLTGITIATRVGGVAMDPQNAKSVTTSPYRKAEIKVVRASEKEADKVVAK
ncbi:MAG: OmpA family protein, partial [Spongiibacteraceae bacterium]